MKYRIHGRFVLDVVRRNGRWLAFRPGLGTRRQEADLVVPSHLAVDQLLGYLEDVYHEFATPGSEIGPIDD